MADKEPRLLTEDEAYAIAAAEVKRETASRDEEISKLKAENLALANEKDTVVARETAANERAGNAETALKEYQDKVQKEAEQAKLRETRITALREKASRMPDAFFTDPERVNRVAAMSEDDFNAFAADLAAASSLEPGNDPPRETAMRNVADSKPNKPDFSKLFERPKTPVQV